MGIGNKVKELRDKIDEFYLKILDLFQSRAIHASKIGEIKKESPDFDGIFYKPEREKEIIDRLTQRNEGPLKINNLRNIFKEINFPIIKKSLGEKAKKMIFADNNMPGKSVKYVKVPKKEANEF